jgi:hypothetical protein
MSAFCRSDGQSQPDEFTLANLVGFVHIALCFVLYVERRFANGTHCRF